MTQLLRARLEDRMGNWENVLAVRDVCLNELDKLESQLDAALARGDAREARLLAHSLKADLKLFDRAQLAALAREIEQACREDDLAHARPAWRLLRPQLAPFAADLRALEAQGEAEGAR